MKKVLMYYAFFGVEGDDQSLLSERKEYIVKQLKFLSLITDRVGFHKKYIVYTAPESLTDIIYDISYDYGFQVFNDSCVSENKFEKPAFDAMKRYAELCVDDELIFYCHSKGVVNRSIKQFGVFKFNLIVNFEADLSIFENGRFRKGGAFPSVSGTVWYNFFWISTSVLKELELPLNPRRHTYEQLIKPGGEAACLLGPEIKKRLGFQFEDKFSSNELNKNQVLQRLYFNLGEDMGFNVTKESDVNGLLLAMPAKIKFSDFILTVDGRRIFYADDKLLALDFKLSGGSFEIPYREYIEPDKFRVCIDSGRFIFFESGKFSISNKEYSLFSSFKNSSNRYCIELDGLYLYVDVLGEICVDSVSPVFEFLL